MTAEIAILNKSAVALAADSAITISTGMIEEKIFNTADKLFQLSSENPIGIMIYNEMSFMETPLHLLIQKFARNCEAVHHVQEAAEKFLASLATYGRDCNARIKENHVEGLIATVIRHFKEGVDRAAKNLIFDDRADKPGLKPQLDELVDKHLQDLETATAGMQPARFIGEGEFLITQELARKIEATVDRELDGVGDRYKRRLVHLIEDNLRGDILSPGRTGIVIAGFGSEDLFPRLVSFEIDGMICDRLKYVETHTVVIDQIVDPERHRYKASILPFAQREMVDRFLFGLDTNSQFAIEQFARSTIPLIREKLVEKYKFEAESDAASFKADAAALEEIFINELVNRVIVDIKTDCQREIEDMVEFMPKPDLADMAEALVELTSIKRKVSRGMETVGGPIDVAIISQSKGFVWIRRKSYFPQKLNPRYNAK